MKLVKLTSSTNTWVALFCLYLVTQMALADSVNVSELSVCLWLSVGYFCLRCLFLVAENLKFLLCLIFVLTGFVEAIYGMVQLSGLTASGHNLFKITGSFSNPGPFAGYLAMVLPMAINGVLFLPKRWRIPNEVRLHALLHCPSLFLKNAHRIFESLPFIFFLLSVISVSSILLVIPATLSRGAWISAFVGSIWVVNAHYSLIEKLRKFYFSYPKRFVVVMIASLLFSVFFLTGMYLMKRYSADGRLLIWKISTQIIAEYPWLGVGPNYFSGAYGEAQAVFFASGNASDTDIWVAGVPEYAFNEYLQIGAEHGIFGLGLFLLMVISPFLRGMPNLNGTACNIAYRSIEPNNRDVHNSNKYPLYIGGKGSFVSLLVFTWFSYPLNLLPFCIAIIFLMALIASETAIHVSNVISFKSTRTSTISWGQYISYALFFVFFCWSVFNHSTEIEAYKEWEKLITYSYGLDIQEEEIAAYQELYPLLSKQPEYIFDYGQALTEVGELRAANEIFLRGLSFRGDPMFCNMIGKNYQALRQYDLSEYWFIRSTHMVPNLLYPHYLLAKMYLESGQVEKAKSKACYVIEKKPKVASMATREMKEEMIQMLRTIQNSQSQMDTEFPGTESFSQQESPKP